MSILTSPALRNPKSLWSYNPIPSGCVLYLPLWHPGLSGPVFKSPDPFGHICTVTGSTWETTGRTFDGDDDKIVIPDPPAMRFEYDDPFSFVTWIYPELVSQNMLISKSSSVTPYNGYNIRIGVAKIDAYIVNHTGNGLYIMVDSSTDSIAINTWYHIAVTYDGSHLAAGCHIYINGSEDTNVDTDNLGENTILTTKDIEIGIRGTTKDYKGYMGEIWGYNRALTVGEISHIHQVTRGRYGV